MAEAAHPAGEEAHEEHHGSIWPLVLAVGGGFGLLGFAYHNFLIVGVGLVFLIVGVGGWTRQDSSGISFAVRGTFHEHPFAGISTRKLGMWLFIVSEIFFFTGLIAAGLALRVRVPACVEGAVPATACWPLPGSAEFPLNIPLTAVNTFVLIASSFTMAEAVHAAHTGNQGRLRTFLAATLLLGATFVSIQIIEYFKLFFEEFLTPWENPVKPWLGTFGTAFYAQTGFHGAHVTGGLFGLLFLNVKAWRAKAWPTKAETTEIVGLYWHLVDIVWIFLFPLMYLIGR